MKKAKWKVGEKVSVPYYCFAPYRQGWNGYLFADGVILERHVRKKDNAPIALVEYEVGGKTIQRKFYMDAVFERK